MILSIICYASLLSVWGRLNRPYRAEIDMIVYPGLPLCSARGYVELALPGLKLHAGSAAGN